MKNSTIYGLWLATILVVVFAGFSSNGAVSVSSQGLSGGAVASKCVASTTNYTIGHQESREILASHGRRAWARVELPMLSTAVATNTISVGLGEDAVLTKGVTISTTTPQLVFGLNTDLPFTGSVEVLTSTGSTTAKVTECRY